MEAIPEEEEALEDLIEESPQEGVAAVAVMSRTQVIRRETPALNCGLPVKDDHELVTLTHQIHPHARSQSAQPVEISRKKYDVAHKKQMKVVSYQFQLLKYFWS